MKHIVTVFLFMVMGLVDFQQANGEDSKCDHCGTPGACRAIGRLVPVEHTIDVTCLAAESEPFCIPGPSRPACQCQEVACAKCNLAHFTRLDWMNARKFVWWNWSPGHATVHTKKKLVKKTVKKTVPRHEWVVEKVCASCESASHTQ